MEGLTYIYIFAEPILLPDVQEILYVIPRKGMGLMFTHISINADIASSQNSSLSGGMAYNSHSGGTGDLISSALWLRHMKTSLPNRRLNPWGGSDSWGYVSTPTSELTYWF